MVYLYIYVPTFTITINYLNVVQIWHTWILWDLCVCGVQMILDTLGKNRKADAQWDLPLTKIIERKRTNPHHHWEWESSKRSRLFWIHSKNCWGKKDTSDCQKTALSLYVYIKTNAARFASSACTLARRCSASNEQLLSAHSSSTDQSPRTHDARHRRIHMAKLRTVQKTKKNVLFV